MGLVSQILAAAGPMKEAQTVGEVQPAHAGRSLNSLNDSWIATRNRSESGRVS
jgi:hypothetical protein